MYKGIETLSTAKEFVKANREVGCTCPCCGQYCRVYSQPIHSSQARSLIWLVKKYEQEGTFIDIQRTAPRFVLQSRDISKLARWKLVVCATNDDETKRTSGLWAPTDKGIDFVYRRKRIPARVLTYDNHILGFSEETVDIVDALKHKFDYQELMSGTGLR